MRLARSTDPAACLGMVGGVVLLGVPLCVAVAPSGWHPLATIAAVAAALVGALARRQLHRRTLVLDDEGIEESSLVGVTAIAWTEARVRRTAHDTVEIVDVRGAAIRIDARYRDHRAVVAATVARVPTARSLPTALPTARAVQR